MANKVAIVTDSTTYAPQEFLDKYALRVAPAVVIWEGEELIDGVDITPAQFYERLSTAKEMPTTSQPSPAACKKIFDELLAEGFDILIIPVSEKLSGTIASMHQAMDMLPDANIELVEGNTVSMANGWLIMKAGEAALKGASLAECKAITENAREHTDLILTVGTLEFLHRGGRIGGANRWIGTALNIKPVLEVKDGRIEPLEKIRTRKKALNRLIEIAVERIGDQQPVYMAVLHANIESDADYLIENLKNKLTLEETVITGLSPAVGTHTGPGTIGLAWMAGFD